MKPIDTDSEAIPVENAQAVRIIAARNCSACLGKKKEPVTMSPALSEEKWICYFLRRRNGTPTRPMPSSSIEAGSGVLVDPPQSVATPLLILHETMLPFGELVASPVLYW